MALEAGWKSWPRHWSTWLGVAAILADGAYVLIDAAGDLLSPRAVVLLNAAVPILMKVLQLLKQDIAVTPEVKAAQIEQIKAAPTAPSATAFAGHIPPRPLPETPTQQGTRVREFIEFTVAAEVQKALEAKKRRPRRVRKPQEATTDAPKGVAP